MKSGLAVLLIAALVVGANAEEIRTLTVYKPDDSQLYAFSEPFTLAVGESAQFVGGTGLASDERTVNGLQFYQLPYNGQAYVAGPATIRLREGGTNTAGQKSYATFIVHRVSSPTTHAAVPAEPGQNFAVVMESSSDLIN